MVTGKETSIVMFLGGGGGLKAYQIELELSESLYRTFIQSNSYMYLSHLAMPT